MKATNSKLKLIAKKIEAGQNIKVAIFGLGSVGNYLLTYLLEQADNKIDLLVVGRNEDKIQKDVNVAKIAASIRGNLLSKIETRVVDFNDVDSIQKLFTEEKPDFVVNSTRAYSGIKYGAISWASIRAYGIWSPLSISVIKNIMIGHKQASSDSIIINTSYSDSVNAWLKSAGLNYPDFGSGNLNHLIPRIKFAVKKLQNLSDSDIIDVTIATGHYHNVVISKEGVTEGIEPLLHIEVNGKKVEVNHSEIYKNCPITMPSDQKRNMMNASSNFEIINKTIKALRSKTKLTFHSPGAFGEIGGFPVTVDGKEATIAIEEKYFSYEKMAKHNMESIYLDGIEGIKNGTLIYTDELVEKVKKVFAVDLPKNVDFSEIDNIANLLIESIIDPNIKK